MARMRYAMQPGLLMTAAMAFFSIALTLNLTGVRLTTLRLADLRPVAMRSYMERQLNMASVPIVRYYDHLRFVYEVESRVRQLRSQSREQWRSERNTEWQPGSETRAAGDTRRDETESREQRRRGSPGPSAAAGQFSGPAGVRRDDDFVETSFHLQGKRGQSDGSARRARERSKVWIA